MTGSFIYKQKNYWLLLPVLGALLFVALYIAATLLYPGGSQADQYAHGFSWVHNYWCNLLNVYALNGAPNPARPVALTGMVILCLTLASFWFQFPGHVGIGRLAGRIIQVAGILSMLIAMFLNTGWHDTVTNLASLFGLIATAGVFAGLYKLRWYGLFAFGFLNIGLVVLNNYLYYNKGLIIYLPVIQKISFASFLVWISCISISLYRKTTLSPGIP